MTGPAGGTGGPRYFLYRLIPPRPSFATDMRPEEAEIMRAHVAYWTGLLERGSVVAFGPVLDPAGVWGLGLIQAEDQAAAAALAGGDPAIVGGVGRCEILPMGPAVARPVAGR